MHTRGHGSHANAACESVADAITWPRATAFAGPRSSKRVPSRFHSGAIRVPWLEGLWTIAPLVRGNRVRDRLKYEPCDYHVPTRLLTELSRFARRAGDDAAANLEAVMEHEHQDRGRRINGHASNGHIRAGAGDRRTNISAPTTTAGSPSGRTRDAMLTLNRDTRWNPGGPRKPLEVRMGDPTGSVSIGAAHETRTQDRTGASG